MAGKKIFIEQRSQHDFAARKPGSKRASVVKPTQGKVLEWAKEHGYKKPDIERVRHTPKGRPDEWRG
ncbi:MAG TPA: hypothetical protein VF292_16185 [Rhodanobacteraceae bacterium]